MKHEAELFRAHDSRVLEAIEARGPGDLADEFLAMSVAHQPRPAQHLDRAAFKLPFGTPKFVGDDASAVLQDLLYEAWEINERFVGEPLIDAFVQLNGSPEQVDMIERGLDWAREYVARRLARVSTRDRGCPYRKFHRLFNELLPFIDTIGLVEEEDGSAAAPHALGQLLGTLCDYIAWSFFEATWAHDVRWRDDGTADLPTVLGLAPEIQAQCRNIFSIYNWGQAQLFDPLMNRLGHAMASEGLEEAPLADELTRILLMAQDVLEMKPFLVRNFRPEKAIVQLTDELVGGFMWATINRIGFVRCGESERDLLEQDRRCLALLPLSLRSDGLLTCYVRPWHTAETLEAASPVSPITVNRVVLEAVHAKLFSFYEQIDVEAILDRRRSAGDAHTPTDEEEDEAIAASIALDARKEAGAGVEPAGRVTSSLRLSRLVALLEGEFGCEARSGKGSELVLHRPGSLQAVVGRHKANPQISAMAIRRILKKLGITVGEWLEVTC